MGLDYVREELDDEIRSGWILCRRGDMRDHWIFNRLESAKPFADVVPAVIRGGDRRRIILVIRFC